MAAVVQTLIWRTWSTWMVEDLDQDTVGGIRTDARMPQEARGGPLRESQTVLSGGLRRQTRGHNILRLAALEGPELGTGHHNILRFEELPGRSVTATCRMGGDL